MIDVRLLASQSNSPRLGENKYTNMDIYVKNKLLD